MLTQREQEVLQRIITGQSNKQIAQDLVITLATVKWYVNEIYSKLHVRNRVQAIVRARELNLITNEHNVLSTDSPRVPTNQFAPENPYKGLRAFQAADTQELAAAETLAMPSRRAAQDGKHGGSLMVRHAASGQVLGRPCQANIGREGERYHNRTADTASRKSSAQTNRQIRNLPKLAGNLCGLTACFDSKSGIVFDEAVENR